MKYPIYLVLLVLLTATACGKWIVGKNPPNTPISNYDIFYQHVKDHYSFFPEKRVDWDSLDQIYRPLVTDSLTNDSLYSILSGMLYTLSDGHVNLYVRNNRSRNASWYLDYPANFNRAFLQRHYWKEDYETSGALLTTWLPDSVGYIYYGSFSSSFSKGHLDYALNKFANAKGLVFDVRNNGGGALSNVFKLSERFVDTTTLAVLVQKKASAAEGDFEILDSVFMVPKVDYYARAKAKAEAEAKRKKKGKEPKEVDEEEEETEEEEVQKPGTWAVADSTAMFLNKPVVVLTNRLSYSATNMFAAFMSNLENVTLMGDRSGGGGGIPVSYELPNGWKYRLSATRTFLPNGDNIEFGLEPDIYQSTGPAEEIKGIDAVIERAKTYILEQAQE